MPAHVTHLNPPGLHRNPAFSQAVAVEGAVRTIYIGGQNAVAEDGRVVGAGDLRAQTEQVFKNLETLLAASGAALRDIVKWTIFVVQGQDVRPAFAVFQRVWGNAPPPAISVVGVAGLAHPDYLVELEAVAVTAAGAAGSEERHGGRGERAALPQGDLRLLESDIAQRLLASTVPARFAYTAADGTPRVLPTWFHWTGTELVMPTFVAAPHVRGPAARLRALRARPDVAITIDTEGFPPNVLLVRGKATAAETDGVVPEYALAARRYLGEEAATAYLAQIDRPGTRMARIAVRPTWVGVLDFQTRLPGALGGVTG